MQARGRRRRRRSNFTPILFNCVISSSSFCLGRLNVNPLFLQNGVKFEVLRCWIELASNFALLNCSSRLASLLRFFLLNAAAAEKREWRERPVLKNQIESRQSEAQCIATATLNTKIRRRAESPSSYSLFSSLLLCVYAFVIFFCLTRLYCTLLCVCVARLVIQLASSSFPLG